MRRFVLILTLLVLGFGALLYVATPATNITSETTIESAPVPVEGDPNPYDYAPIPARSTTIDAETAASLPITLISNSEGYDVLSPSYVRVQMDGFAGSGVIVRPGVVVTNAHVVIAPNGDLRADRLTVRLLNGRSTTARLVDYSRTYDIAVLEIDEDFGTPAQLATQPPLVGTRIIAVGNPSQGSRTAYGTVLELDLPVTHRYAPDRTRTPVNMIVVTNRVVPGYSGGPMADAETGVVYAITVGQVKYYNDPETGERKRVRPYAGAGIHITEVMAEVDRILDAADNS